MPCRYAFGDVDRMPALMENMHTSAAIKQHFSTTTLSHKNIPQELIHSDYVEPRTDIGNDTMWQEIKDIFLDPYFSPLMAEDLSGLPQAYILTVDHDVLRDDGIWYAQRLKAAGNKLTHVHYKAGFHGIMSYTHYKDSQYLWKNVYDYLAKEL